MENTTVTVIISAITGIVTFLGGLYRGKKEVEGIALQNVEKSLTIYKTIVDDLSGQITELLNKVDDLENKIDELKQENCELKDMVQKRNNRLKELENKQ